MSNPLPAKISSELIERPFCKNCGAPLASAYCPDCSQRADVHVPSTRELLHEALEGVTHSDSRLWTTMKYLLFVPGKLTQEFIAGRRVAYLPPFRLYLVMSVMFFLIANVWQRDVDINVLEDAQPKNAAANQPPRTPQQRCSDMHSDIFDAQLKRACEQILRDDGESFTHAVIATAPKAMFIFLPLIAFFHMPLYWWPRHRYAVHLLFFTHVHAFAFLAMSLLWMLTRTGNALPALKPACSVLAVALGIYIPVYVVLALRRVFKRNRWNTFFKAASLFLIYLTLLSFTMAGVVLYAALQL